MRHRLGLMVAALAAVAAASSCSLLRPSRNTVAYSIWHDYMGRAVPDCDTLGRPDAAGLVGSFSLVDIPGSDRDHYAVRMEGRLRVRKAETYTFYVVSDDGSRLFIDGTEQTGELRGRIRTVSVDLGRGEHDIRIDYYEYNKGQILDLFYETPSIPVRLFARPIAGKPSFVDAQIRETAGRFLEWKGEDEVVVFPLLTDVHTSGRETYRHIGYIAEGSDAFGGFDFCVNLGDIGLNHYLSSFLAAYADGLVEKTAGEMARFPGVFLYGAGNHDFDAGAGRHNTEARLSELFQQPSLQKAGGNLHIEQGRCLCYYDVPGKNTRVIVLNSQGTETIGDYYIYDEAQLRWLESVLESTPRTQNVFVLSHYMPTDLGRWSTVAGQVRKGTPELQAILSEYNRRGGKVVAVVCGDSHVNAVEVIEGVTYCVSQGYGDIDSQYMLEGQTRTSFDWRESLCCDVFAFKPETGELRSFRIGAGSPEMDRVIVR